MGGVSIHSKQTRAKHTLLHSTPPVFTGTESLCRQLGMDPEQDGHLTFGKQSSFMNNFHAGRREIELQPYFPEHQISHPRHLPLRWNNVRRAPAIVMV
jgi:hypothetical protein